MNKYEQTLESLQQAPKTWLITGVAGFVVSIYWIKESQGVRLA